MPLNIKPIKRINIPRGSVGLKILRSTTELQKIIKDKMLNNIIKIYLICSYPKNSEESEFLYPIEAS